MRRSGVRLHGLRAARAQDGGREPGYVSIDLGKLEDPFGEFDVVGVCWKWKRREVLERCMQLVSVYKHRHQSQNVTSLPALVQYPPTFVVPPPGCGTFVWIRIPAVPSHNVTCVARFWFCEKNCWASLVEL